MSPEQFVAMCRALPQEIDSAPQAKLHEETGDIFRQAQADNFASEANAAGQRWPPRRHSYPWPILRKTRKMINAASQRGAPGNLNRSSGRSLLLGIADRDVPYAKYHQFGTRKLPARQFFYLREEHRRRMLPPVRSHLLSVFLRTKGRFSANR